MVVARAIYTDYTGDMLFETSVKEVRVIWELVLLQHLVNSSRLNT